MFILLAWDWVIYLYCYCFEIPTLPYACYTSNILLISGLTVFVAYWFFFLTLFLLPHFLLFLNMHHIKFAIKTFLKCNLITLISFTMLYSHHHYFQNTFITQKHIPIKQYPTFFEPLVTFNLLGLYEFAYSR